jgi:hypothetical protein
MRMIERRLGADAHELARADFDHRDTWIVVEVRNNRFGHGLLRKCWLTRRAAP